MFRINYEQNEEINDIKQNLQKEVQSNLSFKIGYVDEFTNFKDTSDVVIHNFNMDLDNNIIKIISTNENIDLETTFDRCNN